MGGWRMVAAGTNSSDVDVPASVLPALPVALRIPFFSREGHVAKPEAFESLESSSSNDVSQRSFSTREEHSGFFFARERIRVASTASRICSEVRRGAVPVETLSGAMTWSGPEFPLMMLLQYKHK